LAVIDDGLNATLDDSAAAECDGINTHCFPAGTLVATGCGPEPIEEIRRDNQVWAFDLVTGTWRLCRVLQTFVHDFEGTSAFITVDGETIESTAGHPFWVVRGEDLADRNCPKHITPPEGATTPGRWVEAGDVRVGDDLLLRDGRIVAVQAVRREQFKGKVYNFSVAELESYAVGVNNVLVHNTGASCDYLDGSGGRWGGAQTRALNDQVATQLEADGLNVTNGAGRGAEEWIPGPDGGTKGGTWVDITAQAEDGSITRVQTIDTLADGVTPTLREAAAAGRIVAKFPNDQLILIPK
jgi:hypothetical protein